MARRNAAIRALLAPNGRLPDTANRNDEPFVTKAMRT